MNDVCSVRTSGMIEIVVLQLSVVIVKVDI